MEELLRAGAELHFVPCWGGKYIGLAVTYRWFCHGLQCETVDQCVADAKEWVETVKFSDGSQWTPEQAAKMQVRA